MHLIFCNHRYSGQQLTFAILVTCRVALEVHESDVLQWIFIVLTSVQYPPTLDNCSPFWMAAPTLLKAENHFIYERAVFVKHLFKEVQFNAKISYYRLAFGVDPLLSELPLYWVIFKVLKFHISCTCCEN